MDFTRRVTHAYAIPHEAPIRDGGVRSPVRLLNRDAVPSSAQHFSLKLYLILVFLVGICPAHAQSAATPKPLPASGATDRQRSILCGSARGDNRESFEACARGTGQHHKRPPLFRTHELSASCSTWLITLKSPNEPSRTRVPINGVGIL